MVAVIILNWNGVEDTIECMKSLYKMDYEDFFVIVGDNGSTDGSVLKLKNWCSDNEIIHRIFHIGEKCPKVIARKELIIYEMDSNFGFSVGNNNMIKFISPVSPDYYFLLNNDTEVCSDMMSQLMNFASSNSQIGAFTPQIRLFRDKSRIWNCGGSITWGTRKYHYGHASVSQIKEQLYIPCSFLTGCALLFRKDLLKSDGNLFTEKFFFGEEDFELSLRAKKRGIKMACVIPSVIYHKVGTSTRSAKSLKRSFIYYMNRFINMRDYMSGLQFWIWKKLYIPYIFRLVLKESNSISATIKFICILLAEVKKNNGVSKAYFEEVMFTNKIIQVSQVR